MPTVVKVKKIINVLLKSKFCGYLIKSAYEFMLDIIYDNVV